MTRRSAEASLQRTARVAGLAYLLIIVTSMFFVMFVEVRVLVPGDGAATITNIAANQFMFRLSTAYDLVMYSGVVLLSVALYVLLRRVSRNLALLALLWRMGEAFTGAITVLASLVMLRLLEGGGHRAAPASEQLEALVEMLVGVREGGLVVLTVFICLGTIVFCYLFFKSVYIPRWLSVWGIAAFALMLVVTFVKLLVPGLPETVQTVSVMPVALFEAVIGLWLMLRGVTVRSSEA